MAFDRNTQDEHIRQKMISDMRRTSPEKVISAYVHIKFISFIYDDYAKDFCRYLDLSEEYLAFIYKAVKLEIENFSKVDPYTAQLLSDTLTDKLMKEGFQI